MCLGFLQASSPAVFLLLSCLALCFPPLHMGNNLPQQETPLFIYYMCMASSEGDRQQQPCIGRLYIIYVWQAGFRFDRYVVYGQRLWLSGYFCRMFIFFSFILIPLWTPCQLRFSHLRAFFDCSCSHILFVLPGGNDRRVDSLSFFYFLSHLPVL